MSGDQRQQPPDPGRLSELREQAQLVASQLPGPLRLLRVRAGDVSIEVEWQEAGAAHGGAAQDLALAGTWDVAGPAPAGGTVPAGAAAPGDPAPGDGQMLVTAPMVGTFYRAPSPGADPFVQPGDLVEPGQQVGIVEAMKLMNAVTAEYAGEVTGVLAQDGQPVEFGQPLVAISATAGAVSVAVGS